MENCRVPYIFLVIRVFFKSNFLVIWYMLLVKVQILCLLLSFFLYKIKWILNLRCVYFNVPKVHVRYCRQFVSVVIRTLLKWILNLRCVISMFQRSMWGIVISLCPSSSVHFSHFHNFLTNHLTKWNKTWKKCFLGCPFYMIFVPFGNSTWLARVNYAFWLTEISSDTTYTMYLIEMLHSRNVLFTV